MGEVLHHRRSRTADVGLLLTSLYWVCRVRLGLTFSTLDKIRVSSLPDTLSTPDETCDADRLSWAIRRASRFVPQATCLTQAQSLQIMLSRNGIATRMILGVATSASQNFLAHAWLEKESDVLIGGTRRKISTYSRIADYGPTSK